MSYTSFMITAGILAGFICTLLIYRERTGETAAVLALYPLSFILAVLLCRFLNWYSSSTTYETLLQALTDYSVGSFCGSGIVPAACLGGLIVSRLGLCRNRNILMDCAAPGFAIMMVFIRLSAWGTGKCQGGKNINAKLFQIFPFSVKGTDAAGNVYHRFATFFVGALLYLAMFFVLRRFYESTAGVKMKKPASRYGNVWKLMLTLYAALEIVLDSTRIDSMHFTFRKILTLNRFSTFISIGQLVPAFIFLFVFIYYFKCSKEAGGFSAKHIAAIAGFVLGLVLIGYLGEYKWQRLGLYRSYLFMTAGAALIAGVIVFLYMDCRRRKGVKQ